MLLRGVCAPVDQPLFGPATVPLSSALAGDDELMLSPMPDAVREAVLEPAGTSDLVLAIMGACHDLMTPAVVGAGNELIGEKAPFFTVSPFWLI
jgi:hypothetical protein